LIISKQINKWGIKARVILIQVIDSDNLHRRWGTKIKVFLGGVVKYKVQKTFDNFKKDE
jgi:hypothetical protein